MGNCRPRTNSVSEIVAVAERELATQGALSSAAIKGGADATKERPIIDAWRDYYLTALSKVPEIAVTPGAMDAAVAAAQERVKKAAASVRP